MNFHLKIQAATPGININHDFCPAHKDFTLNTVLSFSLAHKRQEKTFMNIN